MSQSTVSGSEVLAPTQVEGQTSDHTTTSASNNGMDCENLPSEPSKTNLPGVEIHSGSKNVLAPHQTSEPPFFGTNQHEADSMKAEAELISVESARAKRKTEEDDLESAKKRTRTTDPDTANQGAVNIGATNDAYQESSAPMPANPQPDPHSAIEPSTRSGTALLDKVDNIIVAGRELDTNVDADTEANEDADVDDADVQDADVEDEDDEDDEDADEDNDASASSKSSSGTHNTSGPDFEIDSSQKRHASNLKHTLAASSEAKSSLDPSVEDLNGGEHEQSDKESASPASTAIVNDEDEDEDESANEKSGEEDSDQEQRRRQAAVSLLTEIEIDFAKFRDQLQADQVARCDLELELCENGTHPELEAVYESIRERRDQRIQQGQKLLDYQLKCIDTQTKAARVQIHQQFLKDRFEARSKLLCNTTREWYQVNIERRAADKLVPDYGYSADIVNNHAEIAQLAHLAKVAGFPAAPTMSTATDQELNEDLLSLGLRH